jgi:isochorismate synthase
LQKEIHNFFDQIQNAYSINLPFVVYRKPNESLVSAMVQNNNELFELKNFNETGFVFAPFSKLETKIVFPISHSTLFSIDISNIKELEISYKNTEFQEFIKNENEKKHHISLVSKAIDCIQKNEAKKIVVSRKEVLKFDRFNVFEVYKKMLQRYQNAFVYLWYHPKVGCWMGASPEKLIHCSDDKFETMALAGTQAFDDKVAVVWNEKEKIEQQFVTDYILKIIKKHVKSIVHTKPYTVKAGNLLHLRTDISGTLLPNKNLESLINNLHPTPAVCGLPKEVATSFILKNEGYHRSFYSGYLGTLNVNNESNLFVNLRCMEIKENTLSIYIGGGITASSNPKNEWEETVNKAQVMKSVL